MENMIEEDKRLSKKEILKMYGIDRTTFELWTLERGLPVIEVSTHSKYVRFSDLIEWEEGLIHKRIFRNLGFNHS
jgi:choline kinase